MGGKVEEGGGVDGEMVVKVQEGGGKKIDQGERRG